MIDRSPDVRTRLALDYALGTLHGLARRRFERMLARDVALQTAVEDRRRALAAIAEVVGPRAPPRRVWNRIAHRLGRPPAPRRRRREFWGDVRLAGAFATIFVAVAVYLALSPSTLDHYQATLADASGRLAWVLRATGRDPRIEALALAPQPLTPDRAYELWYVPGNNRPPRSLGLLPPSGRARLSVPRHLPAPIAHDAVVAVSLEPAGGSPTGSPTGPILYHGRWTALERGAS